MQSIEKNGRLPALDGLRGLAALVVLLWHCYLTLASLGREHELEWLVSSPLRIFVSGTEAVIVFFVMSGLVLSIPQLSGKQPWVIYYPRQLVRLYIPVVASVSISALLLISLPRNAVTEGEWLDKANANSASLYSFFAEAALITPSPTINNPLWSLHWELLFSMALPVYLWIARKMRRVAVLGVVGALAMIAVGHITDAVALQLLPVFLVGVIAATRLDDLRRATERLNGQHAKWIWKAIVGLSLAALVSPHVAKGLGIDLPNAGLPAVVGAAGLVFASLGENSWSRWLETNIMQWLGKISFSLYLMHMPILLTIVLLNPGVNPYILVLLGMASSIAGSALFHATIESPSIALSRRIAKRRVRGL